MTDISREAADKLRAAILLANQAWGEDAYTSPEAEVNEAMGAALAALDRAEADKAAAVEVERGRCAHLALQWVEGDCTCYRCLDATHIAAAIRNGGAE